MVTKIYLGMLPPNMIEWIKDHYSSVSHADTWYKYAGDTEWRTVSISGTISGSASPKSSTPTTQIPNVKNIVELEIGSDVTSIGFHAFSDCSSLISVMIPDSVTSFGHFAFENCSSLTSVTIPDSVTSIGNRAFPSCSSLTSVIIGNSVTSIGQSMFRYCDSLKSVTFSGKTKATVQGMDNYSFNLPSGCIIHCTDGNITI